MAPQVVGALHAGKTTLLDMLVEQTHDLSGLGRRPGGKPLRYTDTRDDEQSRGISIKAMPMTLVLPGGSGKSYLVNLIDCPGHVNFNDEARGMARGGGSSSDQGAQQQLGLLQSTISSRTCSQRAMH
jgi:116 kDa U5 small nuclear ribonucleoprotein component